MDSMDRSLLDVDRMTEEEAELYDRQIRLWGVEAQKQMKKSSILMINLGGLSTEVCKNIVLAGIGSLTILDSSLVSSKDLASGFFFRDGDVGLNRVEVAIGRIKSLNPRVIVTGLSGGDQESLLTDEFISSFDVVCLTDSTAPFIKKVNEICRRVKKPFFAATSLGLNGYIFSDLIDHTYIQEKETSLENGEVKKTKLKRSQDFLPFEVCLKSNLNHVTPKRIKKVSPIFWCCLALFELQLNSEEILDGNDISEKLNKTCQEVLKTRGVSETLIPTDLIKHVGRTYRAEFVPTCAILGSVLSQEVLNFLAAQQAPLANFFVFDGLRSAGDIYALGVQRSTP